MTVMLERTQTVASAHGVITVVLAADPLSVEALEDVHRASDRGESHRRRLARRALMAAAAAAGVTGGGFAPVRHDTYVRLLREHLPSGACSAAADAALAVAGRDLVGDVFTPDHYEALVGQWAQVFPRVAL